MDKLKFPQFKFRADGLDSDVKRDLDDLIRDALTIREDKANELASKVAELQTNLDSLTSEKGQLEGKIKVLETEIQTNLSKFDSEVNQRVAEKRRLERLLDKIGFRGDSDTLSNRQIKEQIVKSKFENINLDVSDDVLDGMFATVEELLKDAPSSRQRNFDARKEELNQIEPYLDLIPSEFNQDNLDDKSDYQDTISLLRSQSEQSRNLLFGGRK